MAQNNERDPRFGPVAGYEVGSRSRTLHGMQGIHATKNNIRILKERVISIVLRPKDIDEGEKITIVYEAKVKMGEKQLPIVHSFSNNKEEKIPIRVIRPDLEGRYTPIYGYRYDGLYQVDGVEVFPPEEDELKIKFHFHLSLLPNQERVWQRNHPQPHLPPFDRA